MHCNMIIALVSGLLILPAKASEVLVDIKWQYQGMPGNMQLYNLDRSRKTWLWKTAVVRDLSAVPAKQLIDGPLKLKRGSQDNYLLVYHNQSDKPVYFFAAPHQILPEKNTLGFKFHCLCINHAFKVPAKHYWYRVVRLVVSPGHKGDRLEVKHTLVAINKSRMKKFELKK